MRFPLSSASSFLLLHRPPLCTSFSSTAHTTQHSGHTIHLICLLQGLEPLTIALSEGYSTHNKTIRPILASAHYYTIFDPLHLYLFSCLKTTHPRALPPALDRSRSILSFPPTLLCIVNHKGNLTRGNSKSILARMLLDKIKKKFDLSVVKSVELEDMAIDFTGPDPWSSTLSSNQLIANLAHIPGFNWPIQQVQLKVVVQDYGVDLGQLESPFTAATVVRGRVLSSISHSTMKVFPESHTAFAGFISALATQPAHTFSIKGTADIIFDLGLLGVHTIHGIDFVSDLTLRGLDSFRDIRCTAITETTLAADVKKQQPDQGQEPVQGQGAKKHMVVKALFDIYNPSQLLLTLGDCVLAISVPSKDEDNSIATNSDNHSHINTRESPLHHLHIGTLHLDNLTLLMGENDARTGTMVLDTTIDATRRFLKNAEHTSQKVHLSGFQGTSKNEALASGLVTLSTSLELPIFHASSLLPEPATLEATT